MTSDKKLMNKAVRTPAETIKVDIHTDQVVCNGGIGPLGHPQVWYSFDKKTAVSCHYCGRHFVKS